MPTAQVAGPVVAQPPMEVACPHVPESDFDCPVCLEMLVKPVVAPCGHTVCQDCYEAWVEEQQQDAAVCPVCRCGISSTCPGVCLRMESTIRALFPARLSERATKVEERKRERAQLRETQAANRSEEVQRLYGPLIAMMQQLQQSFATARQVAAGQSGSAAAAGGSPGAQAVTAGSAPAPAQAGAPDNIGRAVAVVPQQQVTDVEGHGQQGEGVATGTEARHRQNAVALTRSLESMMSGAVFGDSTPMVTLVFTVGRSNPVASSPARPPRPTAVPRRRRSQRTRQTQQGQPPEQR